MDTLDIKDVKITKPPSKKIKPIGKVLLELEEEKIKIKKLKEDLASFVEERKQ